MHTSSEFDVAAILNSLFRRKGLILATFFVVFSLAVYAAIIWPDVYRSSTVMVVIPQRVPTSYVTSTVTTDPAELMQSISQKILGRTQLEKIVREMEANPDNLTGQALDSRVQTMRRKIQVDLRKTNLLQLSFEAEEPKKAQQVTSRLASLFIDQNLQVREQQAMGTRLFIGAEADRLRKELEEQELVVNRFKGANRYELPEHLDTNLRTVEQLRKELEANNLRLAALQERRGNLLKQSVESDIFRVDAQGKSVVIAGEGLTRDVQIGMKKKELDALLQRYSAKHPDVISVAKEIELLEAEEIKFPAGKTAVAPKTTAAISPLKQVLQAQIADIDIEAQTLRAQIAGIRNQIGVIQARVESTPMRAIELSKISRNYDITLKKYQDLLGKSMESELSENLEKKNQGEQFQIFDPANLPLGPVRPNRLLIVVLGLAVGLGGGVGIAYLWDMFDTSFKRGDEIISYVDVPLLATLPALSTRGSVVEQRKFHGVLALASIAALGVGLVLVRLVGPLYF